ncbi:hypothetical protein A2U01_0097215, partial [Trifolium medium]|nr:hypothetical protein [Trifolium medium]
VRAVLEGLDEAVSDSDGSEGSQRALPLEVQDIGQSKGYNLDFGKSSEKLEDGTVGVLAIPRMSGQVIEPAVNRDLGT